MSKLESIVRSFNFKKYLIYPLFFLSLNCGSDDSSNNPIKPTPTSNKLPETTIIKPNNNQSFNTNSVTVEWSGNDSDGRIIGYGIALDGVGGYVIPPSKTYTNLTNGSHVFRVTSQDDKEAYDPTPAQVTFTVQKEIIGPSENTNSNGYARIELGSSIFDVYVKNLSNQPLNNIKVTGNNYGSIQGFLAEDFSYTYLSELYYTGGFGKIGKPAIHVDMFLRAKNNNEIRIRNLPDLRNNQNLEYLGTASLSDLKYFYEKHDIIFKSMSHLEFIVKATGEKAFGVSLEAAKAREWIINNSSSYGKLVNEISSFVGQSWDPDAFYFDIYQHKLLKVVNHYFDEDKLCTLKGKVTNSNNQPIQDAGVSIDNTFLFEKTNSNGKYVIKSYIEVERGINSVLLPGNYTVTGSAANYVIETKNINIVAPIPPYYSSTKLDFQLLGPIGQNKDTIIFQPKSEGIDSHVRKNLSNNQGDQNNYGNDGSLYAWYQPNVGQIRSFIKFDLSKMPSFSQINSAVLYLSGVSWHVYDSKLDPATVEIKKVSSSWSEQIINWNNQPSTSSSLTTKQISSSGWYDFNITSTVTNWLKGTETNYGIAVMLYQESGNQQCTFHSSDISGSTQPKLMIIYTK